MIGTLEEAILDTIKLLPFLFITYLIMEYIEHKMSEKSKDTIKKSGKLGPLLGGIAGTIPQCGFSASATNLYAGRVISLGTLIAVYLSTSDEMLPIFISEAVPFTTIIKILAIKLVIGIISGFAIDFIIRLKNKHKYEKMEIRKSGETNLENCNHDNEDVIGNFCEHEHCNCSERGIVKSAIKHTLNILLYIFIITLVINGLVELIGEENIANFVASNSILGPVFASLVGLIPNCAASVIITNLYIENIINSASLIAGLLTGAGVGLIVLFRMNKNIKENILITVLIYGIGVVSGIALQLMGIMI